MFIQMIIKKPLENYSMTKQKHEENLVEQHALDRLAKVEKEQRKAYKKEKHHSFAWQQWIMIGLLVIVLATMLYTIF